MCFPGGSNGKEPACQCRRHKRCRFHPWVGKIPWKRAWQPTQYSCPENPMDRGAWQAIVHRVAKSQTWLRQLSRHIRIQFSSVQFSRSVMSDSLRSMHCSPPASSVHGILQARILERVASLFSRGSSQHRDRTCVSHIAGRFFTIWVTREALTIFGNMPFKN